MVPGFKAKEIRPTKTVGQRLKAVRKKRELTLEQVEQLTKVKLKYLQALEEDRHDLLPTEVYSLGFLRCYGEALAFNTKKLLDQYRQERGAIKSAKGTSPQALAPAKRLAAPKFLLTPKTLLTALSVSLVTGLIIYISVGIRSFLAPPVLAVDQPQPDTRITTNSLVVAGKTDPTVSLTINGELISIQSDGSFKRDIAVIPGLNALEFSAINRVGKETKLSRKVLADYQLASSPTPTTEPMATPSPSPSVSP
jgi:cytoskeletal protein RodZ